MAIVHFMRRRPDTYWLWVIFLGGGIGALIYIVAEVLPDATLLRTAVARASHRRRIEVLQALVRDNPAVGNYEELADLALDDGQFAKAREAYDRVLASMPDSIDARYRRGLAELALNDARAARADLDIVVARDAKYDFNRAIALLAHAHALTGDATRADELFQAAAAVSTLSETYCNYAAFLIAEGRRDEAREWLEKVLAKKATMPRYLARRERPWFQRAKALLKKI
jgi:hypothetical protein